MYRISESNDLLERGQDEFLNSLIGRLLSKRFELN
jgi:hypothetical protein